MKNQLIATVVVAHIIWLGPLGCSKAESPRQLTSEWHEQEEAKIDKAVRELRALGQWNEQWNKFSKLGDYGWRDNMMCDEFRKASPCMSGGYTFSESAFEKVKRGDYSHDPHNTMEESLQQQEEVIRKRMKGPSQ